MQDNDAALHAVPPWFTAPGENDLLAWLAGVLVILTLFGLITLYAAFDRWAEHKSSGTPLAKTIPTMLTIALLYEIFPLDHFNVLLPISAILIALMADWSRFHVLHTDTGRNQSSAEAEAPRPSAEDAEPETRTGLPANV